MEKFSTHLRMLASLLGAPDADAKVVVMDLAHYYDWLKPAAQELADLPLDVWQAEHTRLFLSGYPNTPCPPFESAYLNGYLHGPEVAALRRLYRRMGMVPTGAPADYLGTILECAAYLNEVPTMGNLYWRELWEGHLARWLPRFCRELQTASQLLLYRVIARHLCDLFPNPRPTATVTA